MHSLFMIVRRFCRVLNSLPHPCTRLFGRAESFEALRLLAIAANRDKKGIQVALADEISFRRCLFIVKLHAYLPRTLPVKVVGILSTPQQLAAY